jgi:serine/threonine-protein kinase
VRTTSDLCGRVLDARYRMDKVVATGGMGTVYQGFDSRLERVVAVKVMREDLVYEPGFTDRFVTEARAAARLSDPHVVAVYDRGRTADAVYLVMEYVPGRTLRQELTWGGRLPVSRALDILTSVLKGLQAAHSAGFVHGDIKPENVLLADRGDVKVTDFGLARAIEAGDHRTSLLLGTAAYLAPEQALDRVPDPRSDLYSAGILLFEMLTGHVPFRADSADDVLALHQTQRVPDPSAFVEVDAAIDELCEKATEKNPADRFQSATAMLIAVANLRRQADPNAGVPALRAPAATLPTVAPETLVVASELPAPAPVEPQPTLMHEQPPAPAPERPAVAVVGPPAKAAGKPAVKTRKKRRGIWLALLAVVAVAVGFGAWQLGTTDTVRTPKLVGKTRAEALASLQKVGLSMTVTEEQFSEKREAGTVISSDPGAGGRVEANGTVSVILSKGPERFRVPDVKGMSQAGATSALESVSLKAGQIVQDYSRKVPEGLVVRSDPAVGTPLKRDTPVSLTLSLGPEPVVVPDVRGMTLDQAQATLIGGGLKPRVVEQFDETVPFGQVIGTEPAGGTTAFRGDKVRMLVSKGSQFVPVPSVVGMDTESARTTLENAGFQVTTEEQFGVTIANRVLSQNPSGGSQVERGTLITLTIT